jgi:hypothetical protein
MGCVPGTAIAATFLVSVVAIGNRSYVLAMVAVAALGLVGLVATLLIRSSEKPANAECLS